MEGYMNQFTTHYEAHPETLAFYRLPKALFSDERFTGLSAGAKLLYALMLDRVDLSRKQGMVDGQNRLYVYFTLDEISLRLNCAKEKAVKLTAELVKAGLIETRRQGLGKPNAIYVKDIVSL
jgi:hypothetical protein